MIKSSQTFYWVFWQCKKFFFFHFKTAVVNTDHLASSFAAAGILASAVIILNT